MATQARQGELLTDHLDKLVHDLGRLIPVALGEGPVDAIHDARVATRRLSAALDLYRPVLSRDCRRRFARVLRKLRRTLGPIRDLDVMLGHLEGAMRGPLFRPAAWLADYLRGRRGELFRGASDDRLRSRLLGRLQRWQAVRAEIVQARGATAALLAESVRTQLADFATLADHLSQLQAPVAAAPADRAGGEETLHRLRVAGKVLRYTLEMARADRHPLPASVFRSFKAMQDALGLWHDHVILADAAMSASLDAELAGRDVALQEEVLALAKRMLHRQQVHLGHFFRLWRARGPMVRQAIDRAFPCVRAPRPASEAIAPQRDPDPPGSGGQPDPAVSPSADGPLD